MDADKALDIARVVRDYLAGYRWGQIVMAGMPQDMEEPEYPAPIVTYTGKLRRGRNLTFIRDPEGMKVTVWNESIMRLITYPTYQVMCKYVEEAEVSHFAAQMEENL